MIMPLHVVGPEEGKLKEQRKKSFLRLLIFSAEVSKLEKVK